MPANDDQPTPAAAGERELVITRVFDAPRERVFRAWSDPEQMKHWWGPKGFTLPYCTIDFRPGGKTHFCMRAPDGLEIWTGGVYEEIVPPERIVTTDYFSNEKGDVLTAAHYGMKDGPTQTLITVTFTEENGKTTMTMRQSVIAPDEFYPKAGLEGSQGWSEMFDRLVEYLAAA